MVPRLRLGVALLVPRPAADEIDVLRRACGDGALGRIAPHCTLVPPVNVRQDRLEEAIEVLRTSAAATSPLAVALGPPTTFLPDNPVLYLPVEDAGEVHQLRDRVFTEPLARALTWPFHPHVTLVDGGSPERLAAAVDVLSGYRAEVTFDSVHLLQEQRDGEGRRVWRPIADAALARPAVVGRGGRQLELSVSEQLDPVAAGFSEREWAVVDSDLYGDRWPRDLAVTARHEGKVVGTALGWTTGQSAHLADLVVAADRRKEGIGSALVAAFLSEAAERGCNLARARTEAGGPAEGFWRRLGWVEEARFDRYSLDRDFVQLRRDL